MITISLTPQQLEIVRQAIEAYRRMLDIHRRESTFSAIIEDRWRTALSVEKMLDGLM